MAGAALAQMQSSRLQVEEFGRVVSVPNDSIARLMYYLGCLAGVTDIRIPRHLTNEAGYKRLSRQDKQTVVKTARKYPPSSIPTFIEVEKLPDNASCKFLRFSSLEETVTALGIGSGGAAMMALRRQLETQKLLEVMAHTPSWATKFYFSPLKDIHREEQRQAHFQWQRERNG